MKKNIELFFVYFLILFFTSCNTLLAQKAAHFASKGAFLEISDAASLRLPVMTLECWIKVNDLGNTAIASGEQNIFDKRQDASGFNIRLAGDHFPLPIFSFFLPDIQAHTNAILDKKKWTHLAYIVSNDSIKVVINGVVKVVSKKQGSFSIASSAPLRIGEYLGYPDGSLPFIGDMDELRIWDYARTVDQVTTDMNKKLTGQEAGLKLYLDFESIFGNRINDLTLNRNNAIITGAFTLVTSKAPIGYIPLPAPLGFRAFGENGAITLEWETVANATEYKIYRSEIFDFTTEETTVLASVNTGGTNFIDKTAISGKSYYYFVVPYKSNQEGYASAKAVTRVITPENYTTGVYYYPWYIPEENFHPWPGQYVRYFIKPSQEPLLGHYSEKNAVVVNKHLNWMLKSGIDFMVSSWWGPGSNEDKVLKNTLLPEIEKSSMKFCVYYESTILGQGVNGIDISGSKEDDLIQHFNYLEQNYFTSPAYFKIDNRPVVFLYLASIYQGNYIQAFQKLRAAMTAKGVRLFLIGDLDGWRPIDPTRAAILDGISPYIMLGENGYPVNTDLLAKTSIAHNQRQQESQAINKLYIPNLSPGFNNICVPCNSGFNRPRQIAPLYPNESTLEYNIKVSRPFIDTKQKIVMITSWNEWHEDTQIEPAITTAPTTVDNSPSGKGYTNDYAYEGYGFKNLNLVADLLGNIKTLVPVQEVDRAKDQIKVFPTVFQNHIFISYDEPVPQNQFIRLVDIRGRVVSIEKVGQFGDRSITLQVKDVPPGVYILQLDQNVQKKLIKF